MALLSPAKVLPTVEFCGTCYVRRNAGLASPIADAASARLNEANFFACGIGR